VQLERSCERPWAAFWEVKNFRTPAFAEVLGSEAAAAAAFAVLGCGSSSLQKRNPRVFLGVFSTAAVPDRHGEDPFSM